jgi:hypothetical protein
MKKISILILLFITSSSFAQDDIDWRVIPSLTDWIEEINTWPDSIYRVRNIKIIVDEKKDSMLIKNSFSRSDSILEEIIVTVHKPIRVSGWDVDNSFGDETKIIENIRFNKSVRFTDFKGFGIAFRNVIFEERASFSDHNQFSYWNFKYCQFQDDLSLYDINREIDVSLSQCRIDKSLVIIRTNGNPIIRITDTDVKEQIFLPQCQVEKLFIRGSTVSELFLENANIKTAAYFTDGSLEYLNIEGASLPIRNTYVPFNLIKGKLYVRITEVDTIFNAKYQASSDEDFKYKQDFDLLIASYKLLLDTYQSRGDNVSYNACYVEMRDKETAYYRYLLHENPSFDHFLTYQLNVFLRAFSDYGTSPPKAIRISIYVILLFALIYLFFPNSWDSHGKRRIMDRFRFFTKYMKRDAGIHEVYLEEKQEDLLEYEDFKNYMEASGKSIPKFFLATALPLYKWAISGTKLSSAFLKRVDVMRGTWEDVPEDKKWWKGILLIGAFTIAIIYDLIIKMLNALMLSINTFTTLGFGEIPIKGLPRYLAIIQGFIGWFMLTIFSVSLISQLLN